VRLWLLLMALLTGCITQSPPPQTQPLQLYSVQCTYHTSEFSEHLYIKGQYLRVDFTSDNLNTTTIYTPDGVYISGLNISGYENCTYVFFSYDANYSPAVMEQMLPVLNTTPSTVDFNDLHCQAANVPDTLFHVPQQYCTYVVNK